MSFSFQKSMGVLLTVAAGIASGGCASSPKTVEEGTTEIPAVEAGVGEQYEQLFNPAAYDPPVATLKRIAKADTARVENDSLVAKDSIPPETTPGFRIQVFATTDIDEANTVRDSLLSILATDSVYVVYDAPYYKIRVGDFLSRPQGNALLKILTEHGYKDAWIVADRVSRNPLPRHQTPSRPREPSEF